MAVVGGNAGVANNYGLGPAQRYTGHNAVVLLEKPQPRYRDDPYVPGARIEIGGPLDKPTDYVDDPYVPGARITRARLAELTEIEEFLQSVIDQLPEDEDDRPAGKTRIGGSAGTSLPGDYGPPGSPAWRARAANDNRHRYIDRPPPGHQNQTQAGGVDDVF